MSPIQPEDSPILLVKAIVYSRSWVGKLVNFFVSFFLFLIFAVPSLCWIGRRCSRAASPNIGPAGPYLTSIPHLDPRGQGSFWGVGDRQIVDRPSPGEEPVPLPSHFWCSVMPVLAPSSDNSSRGVRLSECLRVLID